MSYRVVLIFITCFCTYSAPINASELPLFRYIHAAEKGQLEHLIEVDSRLDRVQIGSVINVEAPGGRVFDYRVDRVVTHRSGNKTVGAYHLNTNYRLIITHRQGVVVKGSVLIPPDETLNIERRDSETMVVPLRQSQIMSGTSNDFGLPSFKPGEKSRNKVEAEDSSDVADNYSVIDIMVLHTPTVEDATDKIEHMVATANIAFRDSDVDAEFRLVHVREVDYSDATANETAVRAMQANEQPFQGLEGLRSEFGADLVLLVRPYDLAAQGSCGWAFLLGANGGDIDQPRWAYGTFNEGLDPVANRYCTDTILAHEAGHIMGSAHDWEHQSLAGKYSYSNGYGFADVYGTVMSYFYPSVAKFSSPRITCDGVDPCGVAIGESGEADNAMSLNKTRSIIAGFRVSVSPLQISSGLWGVDSELSTGEPGRGFQLVFQGSTLVMTYFGYEHSGQPTFYQASGPVIENGFSADLLKFSGGTVLGEEYKPAYLLETIGPVSLTFSSSSTGIIQLPGESPQEVSLFIFDASTR